MKQYDIFLNDTVVGTASVDTVGLYTQFRCQCSFCRDDFYRIIAKYRTGPISLGICMREGESYTINVKVPTKYIDDSDPYFYVFTREENDVEFVPVVAHEKFKEISDILYAKFSSREGKKGLLFPKNHLPDCG